MGDGVGFGTVPGSCALAVATQPEARTVWSNPCSRALAGAAWFVHIAADRAFGYGFRDADGDIIPVGSVLG